VPAHRHAPPAAAPAALQALIRGRRELLAFVERRVGSRADAEDILQSAVVTALEKGHTVRDPERVTAWLYQILRHRITDHVRRREAERRALSAHARETSLAADDPDLDDAVCRCVSRLLDGLKPEYAAILRRTELDQVPLVELARQLDVTPNNAAVRAHRAREALRKQILLSCRTCAEHGCLDCTCTDRRGEV
jgi:RNA polymerase sigma-70 factor (ECF subfamily)